MSEKLESGGVIPAIKLSAVKGGEVVLGKVNTSGNWQIVTIYRGMHCPICKKYLTRMEELKGEFEKLGVELVAISGDPQEKAEKMVEETGLTIPVGYDLSIDEMNQLGLYISEPRSPEETDRPFAEPATYAQNADGKLQLIEISNTPFNRADLKELVESVEWIKENDYPIRGTYAG